MCFLFCIFLENVCFEKRGSGIFLVLETITDLLVSVTYDLRIFLTKIPGCIY